MAITVVSYWSEYLRWRPDFVALLDPQFYTVQWLDDEVVHGRIVLLAAPDAAILISVRTFPAGAKELHGVAATGNLRTIASDLIPSAEQFGKELGCEIAVIESRPGWEKVMKSSGYELHQVSIRKAL